MATAPKLAFEYIVKEPDYCSGKAAIGATRVRVNNVVCLHKQGRTADEIRVEYPDLTHAQIYAALAYYHDHKDEIEAELAEDEGADERYEQRKAKALAARGGYHLDDPRREVKAPDIKGPGRDSRVPPAGEGATI